MKTSLFYNPRTWILLFQFLIPLSAMGADNIQTQRKETQEKKLELSALQRGQEGDLAGHQQLVNDLRHTKTDTERTSLKHQIEEKEGEIQRQEAEITTLKRAYDLEQKKLEEMEKEASK